MYFEKGLSYHMEGLLPMGLNCPVLEENGIFFYKLPIFTLSMIWMFVKTIQINQIVDFGWF